MNANRLLSATALMAYLVTLPARAEIQGPFSGSEATCGHGTESATHLSDEGKGVIPGQERIRATAPAAGEHQKEGVKRIAIVNRGDHFFGNRANLTRRKGKERGGPA